MTILKAAALLLAGALLGAALVAGHGPLRTSVRALPVVYHSAGLAGCTAERLGEARVRWTCNIEE